MFQEPLFGIIIASVILLVLLFLIGLFSVSELVLSSLTLDDLHESYDNNEEDVKGRFTMQLIKQSEQIRMTISIVRIICFVTFIVFIVYSLFHLLGMDVNLPSNYLLLAIGSIILLFISTIIIPPYIVKNRAASVARSIAPYIKAVNWILTPLTKIIFSSTREKRYSKNAENTSKENVDEKDMIQDIVHFYNKTTEEIMVPRMDMKAVEVNSSFQNILDTVMKTGFSRIPVYEETEDDIKGILYVKDLLQLVQQPDRFKWQSFIRSAYFIPETKKIDDLLEEFRSNKIHIAIVVDEFGCTSGLVTMEDVIEEIVGEISDEYDIDKRHFFILPDGNYIFEGKIQLIDFFRETDIPPSTFGKLTEEVDTLAGLLLQIKGRLPHRREIIVYKHYRFQILEADQRRILKIKFSKAKQGVKEESPCNA